MLISIKDFSVMCLPLAALLGCGGASSGGPSEAAHPQAAPSAQGHQPAHHDGQHHQPGMHHSFSNAETWAEVFDDPARDAWQKPKHVTQLLQIASGMTVADVGAGTGYFLSYLSAAVGPQGRVIASDIEPDMVRYMAERAAKAGLGNASSVLAKPNHSGLELKSCDRILIVDTWHHIDDRTVYAQHLAQTLKPGGSIFVVDFDEASDIGPPKKHRLSAATVAAELTAAGLVAEIVAEDLPKQYVVRAQLR